MSDTCPICRLPRGARGCSPGRCFGPVATLDQPPADPSPPPRPRDPRDVGLRPLQVKSKVLAAELRRGRGGGLYWNVLLACGCEQYRWAGSAAKPKKMAKEEVCLRHTPSPAISCAGGCARVAETFERFHTSWVFCREDWYCPACWDELGAMARRGQAGLSCGDELGQESGPPLVACAAACGSEASEEGRYEQGWVLCRRMWFCGACARVHVFGEGLTAPALG